MKKTLSLVFAFGLLVSMVSMSFAAVTISGNTRLWYQNLIDDGNKKNLSTFKFDRLELNIAADITNNSGVKGDLQFRSLRTDKENADIRVDYAYFYQKNLFMNNDELDAGAFDPMPFKNGYGNAMISAGLGFGLQIGNSVGLIYTVNNPVYNFAFGLCNAFTSVSSNSTTDVTSAYSPEGFDYSLRVNYLPLSGVKVGMGYEHVAILDSSATPPTQVKNSANDYYTAMVIDASYNDAKVPYSGMIEYLTFNPTEGGKSYDALSGVYGEGAYNFGRFKVYAGRGINITDSTISNPSPTYKKSIYTKAVNPLFTTPVFAVKNNYNTMGITYPVTSATTIQGEYVVVDDDSAAGISGQSLFGIRMTTKF